MPLESSTSPSAPVEDFVNYDKFLFEAKSRRSLASKTAIACAAFVLVSMSAPEGFAASNVDMQWGTKLGSINDNQILISSIAEKIRGFSRLELNWDEYGGVSPKSQTVEDAVSFLHALPSNVKLPYASISGDGEIGLFWEYQDLFIDVSFAGNKTYSFFAKVKEDNNLTKKYYGDDVLIQDGIHDELLSLIDG